MGVWKYRLEEEYRYQLPIRPEHGLLLGGVASITESGLLIVSAGYAWDGCSPKWRIGDVLLGTPDAAPDDVNGLPKTYYASLVHDVLCQFERELSHVVTRREIDMIFRRKMQEDGFGQAALYYGAVRTYAWARVLYPYLIGWWRSRAKK
jgi:hypothetical protein